MAFDVPSSLILHSINLALSFYMLGLIGVIQFAHYPLFANLEVQSFHKAHRRHSSAMGLLAGPAMVAELATSLILFLSNQQVTTFANLVITMLLWGATFLVSVPLHRKLEGGFSPDLVDKLVQTNWVRTSLWSLKAGLAAFLMTNS